MLNGVVWMNSIEIPILGYCCLFRWEDVLGCIGWLVWSYILTLEGVFEVDRWRADRSDHLFLSAFGKYQLLQNLMSDCKLSWKLMWINWFTPWFRVFRKSDDSQARDFFNRKYMLVPTIHTSPTKVWRIYPTCKIAFTWDIQWGYNHHPTSEKRKQNITTKTSVFDERSLIFKLWIYPNSDIIPNAPT